MALSAFRALARKSENLHFNIYRIIRKYGKSFLFLLRKKAISYPGSLFTTEKIRKSTYIAHISGLHFLCPLLYSSHISGHSVAL